MQAWAQAISVDPTSSTAIAVARIQCVAQATGNLNAVLLAHRVPSDVSAVAQVEKAWVVAGACPRLSLQRRRLCTTRLVLEPLRDLRTRRIVVC
mmetsp:Transcript_17484/g.47393  ORF Transcript_17484/g.47393 Transcript_17484/m.47393 type:complete len:94 (-) Transcript_17484:1045-1326(-)